MSAPRAIFLSYASQDSEAARHIAEGLREAGLEVWFDQSELRGGDAWDSMIRRQVKECFLFMPIISANTESRSEGYFRLEWKLAVDRSQFMAEDQAFLVPVVIDDTREASARVPEGFHARQWTRLPEGHTTPQFVAQVRRLMDPGVSVPREPKASSPPPVAASTPAAPPKPSWFTPAKGITAAVAVVVGIALALALKPSGQQPSPAVAQAPANPSPATIAPVSQQPAVVAEPVGTKPEPAATKPASRERTRPSQGPISAANAGMLRPAVVDDADVPQIRLVQAGGASAAPQESGVWEVQVELSFWETIKGSTMREDYEEYLKKYPEGRFAGLARNRVKLHSQKR